MVKRKFIKPLSIFLLLSFINQIIFPTAAYALTGGPSQPEVQSFEPVTTTQMVDPFTGDFNYNIPLLDVDGYPINIAYHSGITTDQEASWVGLGWNLNPGVINRSMRGIPDDFDGDIITKKTHLNPDWTIGASLGVGLELFGWESDKSKALRKIQEEKLKMSIIPQKNKSIDLGLNFGVNYNNYKGIGFEFGMSPSYNASNKNKTSYTLGMSNSSRSGANLQPNVGINFMKTNADNSKKGWKIGGGFNINSEQGLKDININASYRTNYDFAKKYEGKILKSKKQNSFTQPANLSFNNFASTSYTPVLNHPQSNMNVGLNFKMGWENPGLLSSFNISGYYSRQWLGSGGTAESKRKSYGALNLQNAADNGDESMLDFNREKDGSFSSDNPVLGIPQLTNDLYSISGQGVSGMFKAYRSDMPTLYDHESRTGGNHGGSVGFEVGVGGTPATPSFKFGGDITYNYNSSRSGPWKSSEQNNILQDLGFNAFKANYNQNPLSEPSYFKVVGEKNVIDKEFLPYKDLNNPVGLKIHKISFLSSILRDRVNVSNNNNIISFNSSGNIYRTKRDKRNIFVRELKASDYKYCFDRKISISPLSGSCSEGSTELHEDRINTTYRPSHHTSEISVIKPDGSKYVYGIPAYNKTQTEVSFSNIHAFGENDCKNGQITYNPAKLEDFESEDKGVDQYFERTNTPGYAHSYLLTDILSNDYSDLTDDGPTPDDIGNYTNIKYTRVTCDYNWRVPCKENKANYNEGLKSDPTDDKANFVFGTKEIWHVNSIVGKNHTAYFYISIRNDAYGVNGENGGVSTSQSSYKLDSISLFTNGLTTKEHIKTVYFEYDYQLCPNVENNYSVINGLSDSYRGKLTLRKIYFKYGSSNKGRYNAYVFNYANTTSTSSTVTAYNPEYNLKAYDSWGTYKAPYIKVLSDATVDFDKCGKLEDENVLFSKDFPYVIQDKTISDINASAWNLTEIILPSGGKINIEYEADDYAYVQEKQAMQMYRLIGFANTANGSIGNKLYEDGDHINNYIFFDIPQGIDETTFKERIQKDVNDLYFNILINVDKASQDDDKKKYEYIRGYLNAPQESGIRVIGSKNVGYIKIETTELSDRNADQCNPISKTAWQFTRLYMPYVINPGSDMNKSGASGIAELGRTVVGFFPSMITLIRGIYSKMQGDEYAQITRPQKSWIRLNNLTGFKYGGGCRVKKISMNDNWSQMEGSQEDKSYGQEFDYTMVEGFNTDGTQRIISSGVASYEPLAGGDENPYRTPVFYERKQTLVPDDQFYSEKPFGEYYYPSASVGYSRVSVKTIGPIEETITRNGTGKVVHEFYTARDFPTISTPSDMEIDEWSPSIIFSLFKIRSEKSLTMCQSFNIELNDMHGKPKADWNYSQVSINSYKTEDAFSGVKYEYYENISGGNRKLSNEIDVVYPNNSIEKATVGVDAEMFADSRQFESTHFSGGIQLNLDVFVVFIIPLPIPTGLPDVSFEYNNFQSGVVNKIVNRYGILKSTTAFEEGASLKTENILFDAETGEVVLTKTQNEFEDYLYNSTYPAHWVYEGMGQAYKNDGGIFTIEKSNSSTASFEVKNGFTYVHPSVFFVTGDVLRIDEINSGNPVWVHQTSEGYWTLINNIGEIVTINSGQEYTLKVMQSGRKNMQTLPIASYTSLNSPINDANFVHNSNSKILHSEVTEYDSIWPIQDKFTTGNKLLSQNLINESVDLFNYFIKSGKIQTSHMAQWVCADSINQKILTDSTPYNTYNVSFDSVLSGNSTFLNSTYKQIWDESDASHNYKIYKRHAVKKFDNKCNTLTNYRLGMVMPSISYSKDNFQYDLFMQLYINFNSTQNIDTMTIKEIVLNLPDNIPTDDEGYYYRGNSETSIRDSIKFTNGISVEIFLSEIRGTLNKKTDAIKRYTELINPYKSGLRNRWKSKRQWVFLENRDVDKNVSSNIRKDGAYKTFNNFWTINSNDIRWSKSNSLNKWQYTNQVNKYNNNGDIIESNNPLDQYNCMLYNSKNLLVAVANNSKYHQLYCDNFEDHQLDGYSISDTYIPNPTPHNMYLYRPDLFDTTQSHTGKYSIRVKNDTVLMQTYVFKEDKNYVTTLSNKSYHTDTSDYYRVFEPNIGKYIVSAWVKVGSNSINTDYSNAKVKLYLNTDKIINSITSWSSSPIIITAIPTGPIIEGWQRIEQEFTIPSNINSLNISLQADNSNITYFDDIRIYPKDAIMKSFVYDPINGRMKAELDENNYATFYEYNNEGQLIRVKKETESGIVTLKESRSSMLKK